VVYSDERKSSPISGPILQAKALEFHRDFKEGEEEFTLVLVGWTAGKKLWS
jgi:hypothetical protein